MDTGRAVVADNSCTGKLCDAIRYTRNRCCTSIINFTVCGDIGCAGNTVCAGCIGTGSTVCVGANNTALCDGIGYNGIRLCFSFSDCQHPACGSAAEDRRRFTKGPRRLEGGHGLATEA